MNKQATKPLSADELLDLELKGSVMGFGEAAANTDLDSPGYGLILDRSNDKSLSSIAAVGFALSAYIIGIEHRFLKRDEVYERVIKTLETLLQIEHYEGFFPHFIHMKTRERLMLSEYSSIDTALLMQGIIVAESYFNDKHLSELAARLINRVNGKGLSFRTRINLAYFYMAYNPSRGGQYLTNGQPGYIYHGSMPAEQLMMYFLAAASDNISQELARDLYFGFQRTTLTYDNITYIAPQSGALFLHQFSHAYVDFKTYRDPLGFSWFDNAVRATEVAFRFAKKNPLRLRGINEHAGGFSASDGPRGYGVGGLPPLSEHHLTNPADSGTVQPYSIISSLPYLPERVKASALGIYNNQPKAGGPYGFYEAYNLEGEKPWYAETYLGIDKGISALMISNYLKKTVGKYYMNSQYIKKAVAKLGFYAGD